jgi:transcriptional/translational regulatory protein YebC/TACO1
LDRGNAKEVECLTDNLNRAASEMRVLFRKGQLGSSGSVAWDFAHVDEVEVFLAALDAIEDVQNVFAGLQGGQLPHDS